MASCTEPPDAFVASRTEPRRGSIPISHDAVPEVLRAAASDKEAEKEDAAAEVLRLYSAGYERKVMEPYVFNLKAREQAVELLKTASLDRIRRVIAAFYDFAADDWFRREGFPFIAFCRQFGKLAAKADHAAAGEEQAERSRVMSSDTTELYLRRMKAQPGTPMPASLRTAVARLKAGGKA